MNWLRNLPIRRKITAIILLTCSMVLLAAWAVLAAYEFYEFRKALLRDTTVLADVVAKNTGAAVAFQDDAHAHQTLQALHSEPFVAAACLYDAHGNQFSDYSRSGVVQMPAHPGADGHRFVDSHLDLFRPIIVNEKRIGTIYLRTDLTGVYMRLRVFTGVGGLVLFGAIVLAFGLAPLVQRPISRPILALAETARIVAQRRDYTVRAVPQGSNEIGVLTDAFNHMLAGIAEREKALQSANDSLRSEITERKEAENRAQAQLSRLELLNQITRAIGERRILQNVFGVVIKNLEDHLSVNFSCVCLYDQIGSLTVASVGARNAELAAKLGLAEQTTFPVDENGVGRCIRGQLVYESDTSQVQFPLPQQLAKGGLHSVVIAPLQVESQIFGLLLAGRFQPNAFSSGECEFLRQLSEHIALAAHQTQLYNALQQAYDDLRQTQQAVMQQERLRALGQMASGIAHDINNAISPVGLYTESLLETEANLSERARRYLETIQNAIEDVAATVSRMKEFYRQREPQLTLLPVRINRLVEQVIELSRARWSDMPQQRGVMIKLVTDLAPDLPALLGVESEIREALINLIFNAVDAMPGGGTLTVRTKLVSDAPNASAPSMQHIAVEVTDTGVGMSEDTRRRCLEPFFTTKGERGTGLGLAMVYGVVRRHRADIEIESTLGKGTTMRMVFPLPTTPVIEPGVANIPYTMPSRLHILVVDDDPLLIKSLRDILETDGHVVEAATGGQAGIDAFRSAVQRQDVFDLVITDLGMPYVDGREVAATVKELSAKTPVIMLTGWGQRLIIERTVPPHADRVLNKPPRLRELREAIVQCLHPGRS